jgi:medium-chain acyl-[acyl-carrier-protein] hydrolase
MDDVAFKDLLRELNATPPEILADEMVLDLLLPGLHADFALTENYTNKWRGLRGVITHIIHGVEDTISEAELSAWQTQVALPITIERLPGGHFFIHEKQDALLNAIARQLATEFRVDATSI